MSTEPLTVSIWEARCLRDLGRLRGIGDTEFGQLLTAIADRFDPPKESEPAPLTPGGRVRKQLARYNFQFPELCESTRLKMFDAAADAAREGTVPEAEIHEACAGTVSKDIMARGNPLEMLKALRLISDGYEDYASKARERAKASIPIAEVVALLERLAKNAKDAGLASWDIRTFKAQLAQYAKIGSFDL